MLAGERRDRRRPAAWTSTRRPRSRPQPVPPPARRPPGARPRAGRRARARAPRKRSGASRFFRALGVLLLIAVLAAIIAGAVLLLTDAGQDTGIGQTIKDNLNDQIQAIKDFIQENTQ